MARKRSRGTCIYCGKSYTRSGMAKHLATCDKRQIAAGDVLGKGHGKTRTTPIFHIQMEGTYARDYWMQIEIPADLSLAYLDHFIRYTWVECCGHLSLFRIDGEHYTEHVEMMDWMEHGIDVPLRKVLKSGMTFDYEYDFGTTTELTLKVIGEREGKARGEWVQIMARNDPPELLCDECGKPATEICPQCLWEDKGLLCDACAKKHKCGSDFLLPVVNSPRVGMCGYTGPEEEWSQE